MRETDIRPNELRTGIEEASLRDLHQLLLEKDSFIHVVCPACGSNESVRKFKKHSLSYLICSICETMYVNPRPTPAMLKSFYATSENYRYWNKYVFPASEEARRKKIFRPRAERVSEICRRYGISTDVLVEVGAGFGTFCEEIRKMGTFGRIIAVEPTPDLAATCRQRGLEVIEKPIEYVELPSNTVNVIVTFEVIEHLFAPREIVHNCHRVLSRNGLFIATCPNVKGFDIEVLGKLSDAVDHEHLNYFHPSSLFALLSRCNFEVLETITPGELDAELVRKKVLEGAFNLEGQPFLKRVLIDEWERVGPKFQRFLAGNGLSSHLWAVSRKL